MTTYAGRAPGNYTLQKRATNYYYLQGTGNTGRSMIISYFIVNFRRPVHRTEKALGGDPIAFLYYCQFAGEGT